MAYIAKGYRQIVAIPERKMKKGPKRSFNALGNSFSILEDPIIRRRRYLYH
jgi:hypothetical protein